MSGGRNGLQKGGASIVDSLDERGIVILKMGDFIQLKNQPASELHKVVAFGEGQTKRTLDSRTQTYTYEHFGSEFMQISLNAQFTVVNKKAVPGGRSLSWVKIAAGTDNYWNSSYIARLNAADAADMKQAEIEERERMYSGSIILYLL
jgi:hypothetical protein